MIAEMDIKFPIVLGYRVYPAGGSENFIKHSLQELAPYVQGTIVTVSEKPWNGPEYSSDNTLSLIKEVDPSAEIITKYWKNENEQGSFLLEHAYNKYRGNYLLMIDSDEIITKQTLEAGLNHIKNQSVLLFYHRIYWKSIYYKLLNDFHVSAIGLIYLNQQRKIEHYRHTEGPYIFLPPEKGFCHHYAYVRTNEQMKQKLSAFSHANEIVPNWYENKWLAWDKDHRIENLHPVGPDIWPTTELIPEENIPNIIKEISVKEEFKIR